MFCTAALGSGILECQKSPWEILSSVGVNNITIESKRMALGITLIGIGVSPQVPKHNKKS